MPLSLIERGGLGAISGASASASAPSVAGTVKSILSRGGPIGLYSGLTAAWLRQITYGSCRLGIYSFIFQRSMESRRLAGDHSPLPLANKLMIGAFSGSVGALVGTPAELALVRMGADSKLPTEQQRNYKNSIDCCIRVAREEGVLTMWRGALPTVGRAAAMNSILLGFTSETKERLGRMGLDPTGIPAIFLAAVNASFFANLAAMPFDVVKSRIQTMASVADGGEPRYTGMLDCAKKSITEEGPLVLWRGFTPAFVKLAPYTIIQMIILEKLTYFYTGGTARAM